MGNKLVSYSEGSGKVVMAAPSLSRTLVSTVKNGNLYFGNSGDFVIKQTDLNGKELLTFSIEGRTAKPVSPDYKKSLVERIKPYLVSQDIDALCKNLVETIPDNCTYFDGVSVDDNGMIYVLVADVLNEQSREIEIFSPEGKYLYHSAVSLPQGLRFAAKPVFKGNHLYVVVKDEAGEQKLVKYEIKRPNAG